MNYSPSTYLPGARIADGKVRLLIVNLYTDMGGGEFTMYHLLRSIDRERFVPIMMFPHGGTFVEKTQAIGIETVIIPFPVVMLKQLAAPSILLASIKASVRMGKVLREKQIDMVHCSDVLALFLLAWPTLISRIPVVYSVIFFYEWTRQLIFNILALLFVDTIIAHSNALARDLSRGTHMIENKIQVNTPGIDTEEFRPMRQGEANTLREEIRVGPEIRIVGMIGRIDPVKGQLNFLRAAARVLQQRRDLVFVIVGSAMNADINPAVRRYYEAVKNELREHVFGEKILFLTRRDDIPAVIRGLDLLVCPSLNEGFGLVVLEGVASGVPVILSRSIGAWEVVADMSGVTTLPDPEISSLADTMVQVLERPRQSDVGNREALARDHSWARAARRFEQICASVQRGAQSSHHHSHWSTLL